MKKRLLPCLLAVVMVVSSITPMNVKASEVPATEEQQVEEAEVVAEDSEEVTSEEPTSEEPVSEEAEVEEPASEETKTVEMVTEQKAETLNTEGEEVSGEPEVVEPEEDESTEDESEEPSVEITSIVFEPIEFMYGVGGEYRADENGENGYYYFPIEDHLQYTVTLNDGTVHEVCGREFQLDTTEGSQTYELKYDFEQSYENPLPEGETTKIQAFLEGFETSFDVTIEESPVARIYTENETYSYIEYSNGWYNTDEETGEQYYVYQWEKPITIEMKDGETYEYTYGIDYEDEYYTSSYHCYPEQSQTPWETGNTYPVTVDFMGATYTFEIEIQECPFERVEFENIERIEGSQDQWRERWNEETGEYEEWYAYNPRTQFKLYFEDETLEPIVSDKWGDIEYDGYMYSMSFEDNQTESDSWTVGNSYTITGSIFGLADEYTVSIIEDPIDKVEFEPLTRIEGTQNEERSYWDDEDNEITWKAYNSCTRFTVYFTDGREPVSSDEWGCVEIDGENYVMNVEDSQSYSEQWGVGEYTVTGSIFGHSADYKVSIVESPIESIEFEPVHLRENADGYYDYNEETGNEWFRYEYGPMGYVVTFKDGSTQTDEGSVFEYNGHWYALNISDTQSEETPWSLGEQEATVTLWGKEYTLPIVIEQLPIKSISVEPLKVIEGCNGTWRESGEDEEEEYAYYHYEMGWELCPDYTITMEDGTKIKSDDPWFEYGDREYSVDLSTTQSPKNPWLPGNTYTATLSIGNCEEEFDVTIEESPIESITFEPVENVIETNGWWNEYWDSEAEDYGEYYEYSLYAINPHYTVKMKNGAVIKGSGMGFLYKGMYYQMLEKNWQSYDNQWSTDSEGNDVELMLMGKTATLNVKLIENPFESMEILNVQPVGRENSWMDWNDDGDKFIMYDIPEFSFKLNYKDSDEYVIGFSNNNEYDLKVYDDQYDNPWTVDGDNTFTVKYAGLTATGHVEVKAAADYDYEEVDGEIYITGCGLQSGNIEIPEEIDGKPVVGILSLNNVEDNIKSLTIPDSVRMIDENIPLWYLQEVHIGSGLKDFGTNLFGSDELKTITISEDNPYYCVVDNVIYDKEMTTVIFYPLSNGSTFVVPASVTNIDIFNHYMYDEYEVTLEFSEESDAFTTSDDGYVVYNKEKTKIISCSPEISGTYEMPDTVTEIADSAFKGCENLTGVKVSSGVTEISYAAFYDCTSLSDIDIPATVTSIGGRAFTATALTNVELSEGLKTIGGAAFSRTKLSGIEIPETVETIGEYAFYKTNISSVTIPDSVTSIGQCTFTKCSNLTDVTVGAGVDYIPIAAFEDTDNLENVTLRNNNVAIDDFAFSGSGVKNVNLENTADIIGFSAFTNSGIEKAELEGSSVAQVSYLAFMNCSNLDTVTMPSTIRSIAAGSFDYTKAVEKSTDNIIYLDEEVLYKYRGLAEDGTVVTVEDDTLVLADSAFEYQSGISEVILPEGLLTIGKGTFLDCTGLTTINIPASVEYIDPTAFMGCTALTNVSIDSANEMYASGPNGEILSKDGSRLIWCPPVVGKDYYTVPASVTMIEENAFGCVGVQDIYVGSDVEIADRGIGYDGYYKSMVTIHCDEDSPAYEYAENNLFNEESLIVVTGVSITNEDAITSGGTVSGNLTLKEDTEFKYISLEFYNESAGYMYVKANNVVGSAFEAKTPAYVIPGTYQLKAVTYETAYGIEKSYICDGSETVTIDATTGTTVTDSANFTETVKSAEKEATVAIVAAVGEPVTMSSEALKYAKDKEVELVLADNTGQGEIVIQPTETVTENTEDVQIAFEVSENTASEDEPEATEGMGIDAFNSVTISMNQTDIPVTVRVKTEEPAAGTNFYLLSKDEEGKVQIVQRGLTYNNETGYVEISFVNGIGNAAASPVATFASLRASRSVQNVEYYLGSRIETGECNHASGNNYTKVVEATCTEEGYKTFKCLYCENEAQETLPVIAHKKETLPKKAATCAETGLTKGSKCSVCGEVLKAQEVLPKLAHTEEILPAKAATCTATGLTEGKKCSVCGEVIEAQTVVKAKGHTEVTDAAVAATCTTAGKTAGKHCSVCGEVITAQTVVAAKGHSYGSWITSKAATCTAAGSRYKVCACGDKVTETIKAKGHNYKITKTTKATTKKNGKLAKQCKVCKKKTTETLYRAKSISLSKTKFVYNGKTQKPTVVVKDSKGKAISSSNYKVSFSKGCKNVGTYKVTVKFKGQYSGTLTKTFKITKAKPKITASNFTKKVGDKAFSIKAKISPKGGKVTYKTSNKKIATVSSKGKVTIKKAGKVTITITSASSKNCSKVTKKITVNVKKK